MSTLRNLTDINWSALPVPEDKGETDHLIGREMPDMPLIATNSDEVNLHKLRGTTILFAYPRTGRPNENASDHWAQIPGAKGCTPQACAFRDLFLELKAAGANHVYGLSTQATSYQIEATNRLHLPYPILSDENLKLTKLMDLPTFTFEGSVLLKRVTLIIRDGIIKHVFFPVFPPDRNAQDALEWLRVSNR